MNISIRNGTIKIGGFWRKIIGTVCAVVLLASVPLVASADSSIITGHSDSRFLTIHNTVWVSRTVAYTFSAVSTTNLSYVKTTDGGASWSSAVQINDATPAGGYRLNSFDVWYAGWTTPGDDFIHIAWRYFKTASPQAVLSYNRLTPSTDALLFDCNSVASDCQIWASNSDNTSASCTWAARCVSVTESTVGNVFIKNMQTTGGFMRSTDNGATWAGRTNTTDSPPWVMAPTGSILHVIAVGGTTASYKIQAYDDFTNSWSVISTVTPARNPAYDFKGWAAAFDGEETTWVGFANGTTFRIFEIVWNGTAFVVTEKTAVSGYGATTNDIDLSWDSTNGDLYALYNDGAIKYQVSSDGGVTWAAEQTVTATDVPAMRVPPTLLTTANRFMPIFYDNPDWARNINLLIIKVVTEPEDVDNWFIHFLGIFNINDQNGRTMAASGILIGLAFALFVRKIHYVLIGFLCLFLAAGMSQIRVPDGTKVLEPWIILVGLLLAGVGVILKLLTTSGSPVEDE